MFRLIDADRDFRVFGIQTGNIGIGDVYTICIFKYRNASFLFLFSDAANIFHIQNGDRPEGCGFELGNKSCRNFFWYQRFDPLVFLCADG
ncbi:hypothetical protein D3C85_1070190 [compost metagenome]